MSSMPLSIVDRSDDQALVVGCVVTAAAREKLATVDAIIRTMRREMFTCPLAAAVWAKVLELHSQGVLPGPIELGQAGADVVYLTQWMDRVPTLSNWAYYCRRVADAYRLVALESRCGELKQLIEQGDSKAAMSLAASIGDGLGDPAQVTYTAEDSLLELDFTKFESVESGIFIQDDPKAGKGWVKDEMSLVCAASGKGKTLLLCQTALHMLRQGRRVAFATFELPHARLTQRMLQMMCGYRSKHHADKTGGQIAVKQWQEACEEFLSFGDRLMYFDSGQDLAKSRYVEPFVSWFMSQHDRDPFDAFCFDYLQKVRAEKGPRERHENVNEVAQQLTGLANRSKVAGIVAAQIKATQGGELELRHSRDPEDHAATILYRGQIDVGRGKQKELREAIWHSKNRHAQLLEKLVEFDDVYLMHREAVSE